jgi:hypothetical protein
MAGYVDIYYLMHSDGDLWRRVEVAAFRAACDIINEATTTPNHTNRIIWAKQVLADPAAKAAEMKYAVLQNATVRAAGNNAADSDVQYVVNSVIDSFAIGV